jgi:hypothetical protein
MRIIGMDWNVDSFVMHPWFESVGVHRHLRDANDGAADRLSARAMAASGGGVTRVDRPEGVAARDLRRGLKREMTTMLTPQAVPYVGSWRWRRDRRDPRRDRALTYRNRAKGSLRAVRLVLSLVLLRR